MATQSFHPRIAQLESIPGVGRVSAQTLVATVDTIRRFPGAKQLVAYSGLVPSVRASGERIEYGPITKQGRSEIRAVWVQAAHAVLVVKDPRAAAATLVGTGGEAPREEDRLRGAGAEAGDDRVSSAP